MKRAHSPLLPDVRTILWQSADSQIDQQMEAGLVRDIVSYDYISLGHRPVTLADIQAILQVLEQLDEPDKSREPLLLLSCCPGFVPSPTDEADGLVFYASQYRVWQQRQKQQGRLLLSYIHQVAVGGTYLMHGLSAQHRAASPDTQFHDTVPAYPAVPLQAVLEQGLIDTIIPLAEFPRWLTYCLSQARPYT
jgi:hypothetical protein